MAGYAEFMLSMRRSPGEGRSLGEVLGAARAQPGGEPELVDPDDRVANLVARGYAPGQLNTLSMALADATAELQGEREKIAAGQRRQERIQRDHQAGRITAMDIMRMDFDEGDPGKAERLERRAESLRRQIADASALLVSQPRQEDPAEAAVARAQAVHREFVEVTRAQMAAAQQGHRAPRERRPFASGGGGGVPDCEQCAAVGASRSESAQIHAPEIVR
jgi:hypothetical protein